MVRNAITRIQNPKWEAVLDQWSKHQVPLIEIRRFDRSKHLPGVPWIDKEQDQNLNSYYPTTNPRNDTARQLTHGEVTASAEIFAAFALHAFIITEDVPYRTGLKDTVWKAISRLDTGGPHYWSANARNLFVYPKDWYVPFERRENATWGEWVDLAANFWRLLSEQFAIVRIPDFMSFDSDEYKDWENYLTKKYEERERREYERLRAKFDRA